MDKPKETFRITLVIKGCDDRTHIGLELTQSELDFLTKLCQLSEQESTYGCQPRLGIEPIKQYRICSQCKSRLDPEWPHCYECDLDSHSDIFDDITKLKD